MNASLFVVVMNTANFSIAGNARTLRRLGKPHSGICFDNQIAFLLETDDSAEAVETFMKDEFGVACKVTRAEVYK